ncbi:MAG TPA: xanthine dehydrogenase family protein molybdopterin-binding subunit [Methylophilaceae bacterium]|nr:xanthine dehydrogenase family protein molybdopterin-binding subunit [Methylophilaceae bacterium]
MSVEQTDRKDTDELSAKGRARRNFLMAGAAAGGGLIIGLVLPKILDRRHPGASSTGDEATETIFAPNAFIRIDRQGQVTLIMPKVEMGQGTYTSIPMLIAEELEVDLDKVKLEHAPADDKLYADPILGSQVTGGSTSIRGAWEPMRRAGATARVMLIAAAGQQWNVKPGECHAENGQVIHGASGKKLGYGELADAAATLPVPAEVTLKDPKDFKLIGKPIRRLDSPNKVNGKTRYGIDVQLPNMKIATVAACPVLGGKLLSVDASKAMKVKGVRQVAQLSDAVAVIADHMWAAKQGLAALDIKWDGGANAKIGTDEIVAQLAAASSGEGKALSTAVARSDGDFQKAFDAAPQKHEATYQIPFLAHAAIEPMNCTAHVHDGECEVWVGTQAPSLAVAGMIGITKLPPDKVFVHNHHIGGGFGRRLDVDFIKQAVAIAMQVDYPVKVIWTREEDMQHGIYRPYYYDHLMAGLDESGKPVAWSHKVTGSSVMARWVPQLFKDNLDLDAVEGAMDPVYELSNIKVEYVRQEPPGITTGWWRGVGATHNIFMVETFIDELAEKAGKDPVAYRIALLEHNPRAKAVLQLAADKAGWGQPLPANHGRGASVQFVFGTYLAEIAEVEVVQNEVKVKRVVCCLDCGMTVNPNTIKAQMEGGIVFGISGALWGEITTKNGQVQQSNYDNYRVMRINEAPVIEVHLIQSGEAPGGIGEPGTAALAPALNNAVFAATGKRIRKLPIMNAMNSEA